MKKYKAPFIYHSLTKLNRDLGLPEPLHPLITFSNFRECKNDVSHLAEAGVLLNFYLIAFKESFTGNVRYGQSYYDYDNGGLSFVAPQQLMGSNGYEEECEGTTLVIHPDFLQGHPLAQNIRNYGFFAYAANEALHLSEKEKSIIKQIFQNIREELEQRLDHFSQNIILSQIESLLNYCDRFYQRQFITRKVIHHDLLSKMENVLEHFFNNDMHSKGLPTVQDMADQLRVSPSYLSDMLRTLTGLNAQQHIHHKLIAVAKAYITSGQWSMAEIAYRLGFEHPTSFSRLFKKKTNMSPYQYQRSLNR